MLNWIEQFGRDVRFGIRGLARTPGFTASGGHVAGARDHGDDRHLQRAPRGRPRSISLQGRRQPDERPGVEPGAARVPDRLFSRPVRRDRRNETPSSKGSSPRPSATSSGPGDGDPQRLRGNHGTFNTFEVMGVPPLIGRTPSTDDARAGAEPVVVLGYRFWQRQFGGDPNVLGRQLRLNDTVRTVIGVMPKRFMWRGADVYVPIALERGRIIEGVRNVHLLGRLKPGVTDAQAEADLTPIIADLKKREPAQFPDQWRVGLLPFERDVPERDRRRRLGAARRGRAAAADRVRERVEPAAVESHGAAARDDRARGARRGPRTPGPAAAHREPDHLAGGRSARHAARLRRAARDPRARPARTRFPTSRRSRSTCRFSCSRCWSPR